MARETYVFRDGKLIPKNLAPPLARPRGEGVQVIRDIEPYKNIALDGKMIGGRRQHRDMLRAHNCIEIGDQAKTTPPREPPNKVDMTLVRDIKRAMGKL